MMTVDSVNKANNNVQAGNSKMNTQQIDPVSKNLKSQIENAQKKLMNLSSDEETSQEEKVKKRQEIRQEITSLNQKLRQRQLEQKKEEKREDNKVTEGNKAAEDNKSGIVQNEDTKQEEKSNVEAAGGSMQSMISAGSTIMQSNVHGNVARRMEGRAQVLRAEIKQDAAKGENTERKKEELETLEKKAQKAKTSQFSTIADANKTIKDAREKENQKSENKSNKNGQTQKIIIKENPTEYSVGITGQKKPQYNVQIS